MLTIPQARPLKTVYHRLIRDFLEVAEKLMPRDVQPLLVQPLLVQPVRSTADYPVLIEPLPPEDGGGYLAIVRNLPGCMSDGPTREVAARNLEDAIAAWIDEARHLGRPIPISTPAFAQG